MDRASRRGKPKSKDSDQERTRRRPALPSMVWEGEVERIAWGGLGISRFEDGRVVLLKAPLALFPHEVVRASIHHKSKHAEGEVISWVKPSPSRAVSKCTAAALCGGCDLQESGALYADLKRSMVEDLFRRALPNQPWEWLPAPEDARRHRIQLHWDGKSLGFHQRKKHAIVPINSCPAAISRLSESIPRLEEALAFQVLPSRPQRWELAAGTPPIDVFAIDEKQRVWVLEPDGWQRTEKTISHHFSGCVLTHRPGGFFQVSAKWAMEAFHKLITQWDLRGDTLYDLYGGVGLFSALLGDKFNNFVLVESNSDSIAHAGQNLLRAKLQHQCIEADAAAWMPDFLGNPNDTVLLDPPRSGLPTEIIQRLMKSNAGSAVLIGCDGAAFCRDVQRLSQVWKIKNIVVIDLFPMTIHVECVGLLKRE